MQLPAVAPAANGGACALGGLDSADGSVADAVLIDRATRYITKLTDLDYEAANALLFEIIEYVEPRMKTDQAYPPVVGMAVLRAKEKLTNEQAEERLKYGGTA